MAGGNQLELLHDGVEIKGGARPGTPRRLPCFGPRSRGLRPPRCTPRSVGGAMHNLSARGWCASADANVTLDETRFVVSGQANETKQKSTNRTSLPVLCGAEQVSLP